MRTTICSLLLFCFLLTAVAQPQEPELPNLVQADELSPRVLTLRQLGVHLAGRTPVQVEHMVGKPKSIEGQKWYYSSTTRVLWDRRNEMWKTFIVEFKDNRVEAVK